MLISITVERRQRPRAWRSRQPAINVTLQLLDAAGLAIAGAVDLVL